MAYNGKRCWNCLGPAEKILLQIEDEKENMKFYFCSLDCLKRHFKTPISLYNLIRKHNFRIEVKHE